METKHQYAVQDNDGVIQVHCQDNEGRATRLAAMWNRSTQRREGEWFTPVKRTVTTSDWEPIEVEAPMRGDVNA